MYIYILMLISLTKRSVESQLLQPFIRPIVLIYVLVACTLFVVISVLFNRRQYCLRSDISSR